MEQHDHAQVVEGAVAYARPSEGDVAQVRRAKYVPPGGVAAAAHRAEGDAVEFAQRGVLRRADAEQAVVREGLGRVHLPGSDVVALGTVGELRREEQQAGELFLVGQLRLAAQPEIVNPGDKLDSGSGRLV